MNQHDNSRIEEARLSLDFLITGIRSTRDKSWQLFGVIIAIEAYFSQSVISKNYNGIELYLFVLTSALCVIIALIGNKAIFPNGMRATGIEPSKSDGFENEDILNTYQVSITANTEVLKAQVDSFKNCVYIFYAFLLFAFVGILCSKCLMC